MKTAAYHQTYHNEAGYSLKTKLYTMSKWEGTGYSIDRRPVYIEKSNIRYIRFGNRKTTAYSLIATGVETNNPSYGVCVSQSGHWVDYALDLSRNYEEVKSLVVLCNKEGLHLIHFRDVLEDFFHVKQSAIRFAD